MDNINKNVTTSSKTLDIIDELENNKLKTRKKFKRNIFFIIVLMLVVLFIVFRNNNLENMLDIIANINIFYFSISILLIIIFSFLTAYSFHIVVRSSKLKVKTRDTLAIGTSVLFFNGITPFSTGGQPFQIYYLKRLGVSVSSSTGATVMNFIIYQFALTFISIISVIFYYNSLKDIPNFKMLVGIGITINTAILLILIFLSFSKKFNIFVIDKLLTNLSKIKFLNKYLKINDDFIVKTENSISRFQESFLVLLKCKITMIKLFIVRTLSLLSYYAVAYFILLSVGIELTALDLPFVIALSAFALVFTAWVPTPGASGGAEFAFLVLFTQIPGVTAEVGTVGLLLWRFVTYYLTLLIGFIGIIFFEKGRK